MGDCGNGVEVVDWPGEVEVTICRGCGFTVATKNGAPIAAGSGATPEHYELFLRGGMAHTDGDARRGFIDALEELGR